MFVFYLRSGQPELFTDLDSTFWRLESLEIIYLSSFIYSSSVVLFSLYLVIILRLLLYFIYSVVFYLTLIYFHSSFMNYYLFYFHCISYSVSMFCDFYLLYVLRFAKFYLQRGILSNSSPTCADANG